MRRKLKTSKADREANKRRRRWAWYHGSGEQKSEAGFPHVRRRVRPTHTPEGCFHSIAAGTGEWRPTRAL